MKRTIRVLFTSIMIALVVSVWIGGRDNVSYAIVNGVEATPHQYPWTVAIYMDEASFCDGVIISEHWVLTVGNCLYRASSVRVVAGAHYRITPEAGAQTRVTRDFFLHENYLQAPSTNDIGLIYLPEALVFDAHIQPINLDAVGNIPAGQMATLAGWGALAGKVGISPYLNKVDVAIMSNEACANIYGSFITDVIGCTDGSGGRGMGSGDQGGPVMVGNTLVGLINWSAAAGPDLGYPTGFVRIAPFREWIRQNSGI